MRKIGKEKDEITKEFPKGKNSYCPKCYFGEPPEFEGKVILRKDCEHNQLTPSDVDLLEEAWGIIANVGGGNWDKETPEWQEATKRFRERYFKTLDKELEELK